MKRGGGGKFGMEDSKIELRSYLFDNLTNISKSTILKLNCVLTIYKILSMKKNI